MPKADHLVTTDAGDRFIAALFAPLPAGEEPVESAAFLRELREDRRRAWSLQALRVEAAGGACVAARAAANRTFLMLGTCSEEQRAEEIAARKVYFATISVLMKIPSPSRSDLKLKRHYLRLDADNANWRAAIAADEARFSAATTGPEA